MSKKLHPFFIVSMLVGGYGHQAIAQTERCPQRLFLEQKIGAAIAKNDQEESKRLSEMLRRMGTRCSFAGITSPLEIQVWNAEIDVRESQRDLNQARLKAHEAAINHDRITLLRKIHRLLKATESLLHERIKEARSSGDVVKIRKLQAKLQRVMAYEMMEEDTERGNADN